MLRRNFIMGLTAALAAPAIIRTPSLLMPVKRLPNDWFSTHVFEGSGGPIISPAELNDKLRRWYGNPGRDGNFWVTEWHPRLYSRATLTNSQVRELFAKQRA